MVWKYRIPSMIIVSEITQLQYLAITQRTIPCYSTRNAFDTYALKRSELVI